MSSLMNYHIGCPLGYPSEVNIVRRLVPQGLPVLAAIKPDPKSFDDGKRLYAVTPLAVMRISLEGDQPFIFDEVPFTDIKKTSLVDRHKITFLCIPRRLSVVLKSGYRMHLDVKKNIQLSELIEDVIDYYEERGDKAGKEFLVQPVTVSSGVVSSGFATILFNFH